MTTDDTSTVSTVDSETPDVFYYASTAVPTVELTATTDAAHPRDVSEAESLDGFIDLGPLLVPMVEGVDVTVDLEEDDTVSAVVLRHGAQAMRLDVFSAPRSEGIWDEVADAVEQSFVADGAPVLQVESPWGPQLFAELTDPDVGTVNMRVVGFDGPGWMLRATLQDAPVRQSATHDATGDEAAMDVSAANLVPFPFVVADDVESLPGGPLGLALSMAFVRRGAQPLPVGTPLPFHVHADQLGRPQLAGLGTVVYESRFAQLPANS